MWNSTNYFLTNEDLLFNFLSFGQSVLILGKCILPLFCHKIAPNRLAAINSLTFTKRESENFSIWAKSTIYGPRLRTKLYRIPKLASQLDWNLIKNWVPWEFTESSQQFVQLILKFWQGNIRIVKESKKWVQEIVNRRTKSVLPKAFSKAKNQASISWPI